MALQNRRSKPRSVESAVNKKLRTLAALEYPISGQQLLNELDDVISPGLGLD